jgi:acyl carrier protein
VNEQEILAAIAKIVAEEIGAPGITIGPQTTATDVGGWDSMAHARILAALEEELGVSLDFDQAFALKNVGELITLIKQARSGQI